MQYKNIKNNNSGFAILFAVTLSAILLTIALGVANVALKEIKFTTSAKSTNEAFYAADVGAECALFHDRSSNSSFVDGGPGINCLKAGIALNGRDPNWDFIVSVGLGNTGQSCAKVTVNKEVVTVGSVEYKRTTIVSKGYDTGSEGAVDDCNPTINSVEREIKTTYDQPL